MMALQAFLPLALALAVPAPQQGSHAAPIDPPLEQTVQLHAPGHLPAGHATAGSLATAPVYAARAYMPDAPRLAPMNAPDLPKAPGMRSAKWSGIAMQLGEEARCTAPHCMPAAARRLTQAIATLPHWLQLTLVNEQVNALPYGTDWEIYGRGDHWARLAEFFRSGGDCDDFAAAKYALLRAGGLPADWMRIVVVEKSFTGEVHAVLWVTTPDGNFVLDNLSDTVLAEADARHYRPLLSVSELGWWMHIPLSAFREVQGGRIVPASDDRSR